MAKVKTTKKDRQYYGQSKKGQTIIDKTLHRKLLSCYSCYEPCDVINERKPDCDDDKLNIFMVICDTDIMKQLTKS
jgi:hypothetical protein